MGKVLLSDDSLVEWFVVCTRHVRSPVEKGFDEEYRISTPNNPFS